jgi:phosphatidate cytidylyltransferase
MPGASDASVPALPDPRALRWADLGLRAASAAVLAPLALFCVWLGGTAFTLLVLAAMLGLTIEWLLLCRGRTNRWGGALLLPGGLGYVLLATAGLLWLRADMSVGFDNTLFLLLIVWSSDIGAYLVGRLFGGPRLAPLISPGKTWSGACGGLLAAVAAGLLAAHLLTGAGLLWRPAFVAAGLSIIAQAGDLLESFVKRRLEVKDSSHIIPGHGGLFDRLDGVLSSAPIAALLALTLGRGVVLWQ